MISRHPPPFVYTHPLAATPTQLRFCLFCTETSNRFCPLISFHFDSLSASCSLNLPYIFLINSLWVLSESKYQNEYTNDSWRVSHKNRMKSPFPIAHLLSFLFSPARFYRLLPVGLGRGTHQISGSSVPKKRRLPQKILEILIAHRGPCCCCCCDRVRLLFPILIPPFAVSCFSSNSHLFRTFLLDRVTPSALFSSREDVSFRFLKKEKLRK